MTKDKLEQIILECIHELTTQEMPDSQIQLMIGFVDNLRQKVADADQTDYFPASWQRSCLNCSRNRDRTTTSIVQVDLREGQLVGDVKR